MPFVIEENWSKIEPLPYTWKQSIHVLSLLTSVSIPSTENEKKLCWVLNWNKLFQNFSTRIEIKLKKSEKKSISFSIPKIDLEYFKKIFGLIYTTNLQFKEIF